MSWSCERCDRSWYGSDQTPRCCDACLEDGWRMPFVDSSDVACGLAFDYGREQGNLELRQVLMDAEMERNCDDRARDEIQRLKAENTRLAGILESEGYGRTVWEDMADARRYAMRSLVLTQPSYSVVVSGVDYTAKDSDD